MATIYFVQVLQFSLVLSEIGVIDQAQIGRISGLATLGVTKSSRAWSEYVVSLSPNR